MKTLKGFVDPKTGKLNKNCLDCGKKLSRLGHKTCKKCEGIRRSEHQKGSGNPMWRGGISRMNGYLLRKMPEHPYAKNHAGYVLEHRLVMEAHLGRYLTRSEVVHHINGIQDDNRIENLKLFASAKDHIDEHRDAKNGRILKGVALEVR